jgi:sugar/nucleoside kinase (ribokinase family)
MAPTRKHATIVGIGSALVDILLTETDEFLQTLNAPKGGMTLVDSAFIEAALKKSRAHPSVVPGGSACNTIVGVGKIGGSARFVGKCGNDDLGKLFKDGLIRSLVNPRISVSTSPTGRVLSVVTPDAQRTMFTYLGAASEAVPAEIVADHFSDASIVHIEGYLIFNQDLILAALKMAKKSGVRVSLDLASFTVVEANKEFIREIAKEYVDILIANEDEARAFTGTSDEGEALDILSSYSSTAVLKVGRRGSYIRMDGATTQVGIMGSGAAVDTTGAGDLWAAGFLFGLVKGFPAEKCGQIASACGYEVCQVLGAQIPDEGWERIRKLL